MGAPRGRSLPEAVLGLGGSLTPLPWPAGAATQVLRDKNTRAHDGTATAHGASIMAKLV